MLSPPPPDPPPSTLLSGAPHAVGRRGAGGGEARSSRWPDISTPSPAPTVLEGDPKDPAATLALRYLRFLNDPRMGSPAEPGEMEGGNASESESASGSGSSSESESGSESECESGSASVSEGAVGT